MKLRLSRRGSACGANSQVVGLKDFSGVTPMRNKVQLSTQGSDDYRVASCCCYRLFGAFLIIWHGRIPIVISRRRSIILVLRTVLFGLSVFVLGLFAHL